MNLMPAIYRDLPEAAQAAYGRWNDALIRLGDHALDCTSGCGLLREGCSIGFALRADEQSAWQRWDAERRMGAEHE